LDTVEKEKIMLVISQHRPQFEEGSFRDPDGRVFYLANKVYRTVSAQFLVLLQNPIFEKLLRDLESQNLILKSKLIKTESLGLPRETFGEVVLEIDRVPFTTYPYEWTFDMLRDAAITTLNILTTSLDHGFILKDATAFNILFYKNSPHWIDLCSFETHAEGNAWAGYAQFCRSFLFPLLINSYKHVDFQPLLRGYLGEIQLPTARAFFSWSDAMKPGVLKDVILQNFLQSKFSNQEIVVKEATQGMDRELILRNLERLKSIIRSLKNPTQSEWSDYQVTHHYSTEELETKKNFVSEGLNRVQPENVVDLGCNWGNFSDIARASARHVISVDVDAATLNRFYLRTKGMESQVCAVNNLADPSPAMGWQLHERKSSTDRLRADYFLALALIHHLRISANVPLEMIVESISKMGSAGIIEFVDKRDEMVQKMLTLRPDVYSDYTWENFERLILKRFAIQKMVILKGGFRRLYAVQAK
jgi:hypothetical protein